MTPKVFRNERPAVLIKKKPLLTDELYTYMNLGIQKTPTICIREEQKIIGFTTMIPSPFNTQENMCEEVAGPWIQIFNNQNNFPERIKNEYYGVTTSESGNFTEQSLTYIAGIPVPMDIEVPSEMSSFIIPKQQVAIFESFADIREDTMKKTIDYIYGYWLPNSDYHRAIGNDYGLFEGTIDFENPNLLKEKYIIPITPKK